MDNGSEIKCNEIDVNDRAIEDDIER